MGELDREKIYEAIADSILDAVSTEAGKEWLGRLIINNGLMPLVPMSDQELIETYYEWCGDYREIPMKEKSDD